MHHILYVLAAELVCLAGGEHADAARRKRNGLNLFKTSTLNFHIKAKPVALVQTTGGIEADGGGDGPLEIIAGDSQDALTDMLRPGIAAHQRIVEVLALKRHSMR